MRAKTLNAIPAFDFVYVKGMFCWPHEMQTISMYLLSINLK